MTICRHILHSEIISYLDRPDKILCLEGVRQTGKTTAIEMALGGRAHTFITMTDGSFAVQNLLEVKDFDAFRRHLERDFEFVPDGKKILVIDEAQKFKALYQWLMQIEKNWKGVPVILSGSVMGAFFHQTETGQAVSPAGRVLRKICRPFSFYEFLDIVGENGLLEELLKMDLSVGVSEYVHNHAMSRWRDYMGCGGMPEAIRRQSAIGDRYEYFQNLLAFFWQDADRYLSEMSGEIKTQYGMLFRTVLEAVARLTGQTSTRASILSSDSPAYRTVLPLLLNAAESWHFIFRLTTKMKSLTTKQGTSSKKYLWDVGVANHLINAGRTVLMNQTDLITPVLLENFVAQELIFYLKDRERLFSWKSSQKQPKEMDFFARFNHTDLGVEVKASAGINFKAISQLTEFAEVYHKAALCVVYLGLSQQVTHRGRVISFVPPYLLGRLVRDFTS